jgi:hypothetical protein
MFSPNLNVKLKIFLAIPSKSFKRMEVRSLGSLFDFFLKFYIKSHAHTLNKMGLPSKNIVIL